MAPSSVALCYQGDGFMLLRPALLSGTLGTFPSARQGALTALPPP